MHLSCVHAKASDVRDVLDGEHLWMMRKCRCTHEHPVATAITVCVAAVGKSVGCSVVEAFGDNPKPQELEQVLRLEYRSKLLNPKVVLTPVLQLPTYCVCISDVRVLGF
jgi:hypothetical protein